MIDVESNETADGIEVRAVELVSWANMAEAISRADSRSQAEFFEHLSICLEGPTMGFGRWAMQCREIAEEPSWLPANRKRLASQLEVLAEHMRKDIEPSGRL